MVWRLTDQDLRIREAGWAKPQGSEATTAQSACYVLL